MLTAIEAWVRISMLKKRARGLRVMIDTAPHLTEEVLSWVNELDGICELLTIVDPQFVDTVRR